MKTNISFKTSAVACSCRNGLQKDCGQIPGVYAAQVDMIKQEIVLDHTGESTREQILDKLRQLGYEVE